MTYKQIEASRELRLWIGQIIVPAVGITATILASNPNLRNSISSKYKSVKSKIKKKPNLRVV